MKKDTNFIFTPIFYAIFSSLIGWGFWKIFVTDAASGADTTPYKILIPTVVVFIFVIQLIFEYRKMKKRTANYRVFEELFPELAHGIADIPEKVDYYQQEGKFAVYRNHFISDYEFDFVNLADVDVIYYERTLGIRRPTGSVVGDEPQLVFLLKSGQKKTIKITKIAPVSSVAAALDYIASVIPAMCFGHNQTSFSDYRPILAKMR